MSRPTLNSVSLWLTALGASASLLVAVLYQFHEAKRIPNAALSSASTVDYFSGTAHYAVPVKYNPGVTRYSEKRNYSALTLMLFLPDLSPAVDHPDEMERPGWQNQMTLLFEHGPRFGTADEQIAMLTNKPRGVHTLPEPAGNGCDLYKTPLMVPGDVYVCQEDGSKLVLSCKRESDVPSPSCTIFEDISPDLSLIYHYSATYAVDAVSIDRHVRTLIASFVRSRAASAD